MATNSILQQLPLPQYGKTNWPWTNEYRGLPRTMPDGRSWPKISIVTPSYNQGQFLEETIRSVLSQNYPNLEYIIMDGGSSDNSVEIIKKYEPWLTYWVSEKDNGQADAVYRGFEKASGDIIGWINSDDYYLPNAFKEVALASAINSSVEFFVGGCYFFQGNNKIVDRLKGFSQDFNSLLCFGQQIAQPACFWSRKAFFEVGGFNRNLRFAFDYDLFLRLSKRSLPYRLNCYIVFFRDHMESKSSTIWNEVGLTEVKMLQEIHGIDRVEESQRVNIIKKEKLRLLYCKSKSINNILINPKLLFALIKNVFVYFLTSRK